MSVRHFGPDRLGKIAALMIWRGGSASYAVASQERQDVEKAAAALARISEANTRAFVARYGERHGVAVPVTATEIVREAYRNRNVHADPGLGGILADAGLLDYNRDDSPDVSADCLNVAVACLHAASNIVERMLKRAAV